VDQTYLDCTLQEHIMEESREGMYFDGFIWRSHDEAPVERETRTDVVYDLSSREREVLGMMPSKLTAKQMAASLGISHRTVQFHMDSMYWKLGCSGRDARTQACNKGRKLGYIK
jgi:DNA-binding NarL/FixJ family response regulator